MVHGNSAVRNALEEAAKINDFDFLVKVQLLVDPKTSEHFPSRVKRCTGLIGTIWVSTARIILILTITLSTFVFLSF